jgi:hypothetical protein
VHGQDPAQRLGASAKQAADCLLSDTIGGIIAERIMVIRRWAALGRGYAYSGLLT